MEYVQQRPRHSGPKRSMWWFDQKKNGPNENIDHQGYSNDQSRLCQTKTWKKDEHKEKVDH